MNDEPSRMPGTPAPLAATAMRRAAGLLRDNKVPAVSDDVGGLLSRALNLQALRIMDWGQSAPSVLDANPLLTLARGLIQEAGAGPTPDDPRCDVTREDPR